MIFRRLRERREQERADREILERFDALGSVDKALVLGIRPSTPHEFETKRRLVAALRRRNRS